MHLVVIAAFAIVRLLAELDVSFSSRGIIAAGAVIAYLGGTMALARLGCVQSVKNLDANPARAHYRHRMTRLLTNIWLLGGLAGVYVLGFGHWMMTGPPASLPLVGMLGAMSPFVAAIVMTWVMEYPMHRAFRRRLMLQATGDGPPPGGPLGIGQYVLFNIRHELLFVLAPICMIVFFADALSLYVEPALSPETAPWVILPAMLVGMGGVFIIAPVLIVKIWSTEPLPPGPLREGLTRLSKGLGVKFRRMLVWNSGDIIINAAVVGLMGRFRYVLLSDALLRRMKPHEVQAVFAHEAQHIAGHHIFYSGMFVITASLAVTAVGEALRMITGWEGWTLELFTLVLLVLALLFVFGWISRRLERQCDVHAAATMGQMLSEEPAGKISHEGAAVFAIALQKIAHLNGMLPNKRNWRHGSIEWRIQHILTLATGEASTRRIDRTVRLIKLGIWLALATSIALIVVLSALQPAEASGSLALL